MSLIGDGPVSEIPISARPLGNLSVFLRIQLIRPSNDNQCPATGFTVDLEGGAHLLGPLTHDADPHVSRWNRFRIKTVSVVRNMQFDTSLVIVKPNVDLAGFGMFGNIVQRLLCDAMQGYSDIFGQQAIPLDLQGDGRPTARTCSLRQQFEQLASV